VEFSRERPVERSMGEEDEAMSCKLACLPPVIATREGSRRASLCPISIPRRSSPVRKAHA
jgi:hypothetical protein